MEESCQGTSAQPKSSTTIKTILGLSDIFETPDDIIIIMTDATLNILTLLHLNLTCLAQFNHCLGAGEIWLSGAKLTHIKQVLRKQV